MCPEFISARPRWWCACLSIVLTLVAQTAYAQKIAGGDNFTLIVTPDGNVWSFGNNSTGQLGHGTTSSTPTPTPTRIQGLSGVQAVAAGINFGLALTTTGTVYAWGSNNEGQLGTTDNIWHDSPVQLGLSNIVAIAAGSRHGVALTATGEVLTWGENNYGQIGNGGTTDTNTPATVFSNAIAIGAGPDHTVVIKNDGTAWAWGRNGSGRLGNDDPAGASSTTPVQMIGVTDAVAAYGGYAHTVVRLATGALVAAGENSNGELGDGTTTDRRVAVPVLAITNVQHVAAGFGHNLAVDTAGALWIWGEGAYGALGTGTATDVLEPQMLSSLTSVAHIGAGWQHSIAADTSGVVSTWGLNHQGELGDGTTDDRWIPEAISAANYEWRVAKPAFSVAAGTHTTALNVTVTVAIPGAEIRYTLNGSEPTQLDSLVTSGGTVSIDASKTLKAKAWKTGMPSSAVASAEYTLQVVMPTVTPSGGPFTSAQSVTMATTTSGAAIRYTTDGTDPTASSTLYGGPLTVNATTTFKSAGFKTGWTMSPVKTATLTFDYGALDAPSVDPATGTYAGSVSVTMSSPTSGATIRYTTNNTVPTASSTAYSGPVSITQTTTVRAKAFHSSYSTSPETTRTYTIAAATPTLSAASGSYAPGSLVTISTSEATATLRMTLDGSDPTSTSPIVASGTTLLIGNYTLKVRAFRSAVLDSAVATATYTLTSALGPGAVTTGGAHTIVAAPDGRLYAWGNNGNGQLGKGNTTDQTTPTLLHTITGVTAVSSGLAHSLALRWDGQVYAFGSNVNGRLGDGSTTQSTLPVHISALSNIVSIAAGDAHSLALRSDGRVFAWGANASGQLGLGDSGSGTDRLVPTEITTLSNIVAIAAGDSHSFAITAGGQLYAWGANGNARLGIGTTPTVQNTPALVPLGNLAAVATGQAHTLAMTGAGRVYGWGANSNGQVGVAPATTISTPTLIANLHVSAIAAGDNHSAAIRADGALLLWGTSGSGQVGANSTAATNSTPTVIIGPSSVSTISLGDLHSAAVTSSGEVWTWGESADGRLGNGTTTPDRLTPQMVLTGLTEWAPAPPTIDVPSSTLGAPQMVALTSSTPGAVIRYTVNGTAPTEADAEVPANGQVDISYSSWLRARAFVSGRQPSAIARAEYELQSAAPVISPGTGTYASAQTVTITETGVPGTIRYTLDGTEPTETSTLYSGPFSVSTAITVKAKTFPSNGWSASPPASATLSFNFGTLVAPSASPSGGAFPVEQTVALSATPGATIRFTTNGTEPTSSSPAYSSPISVTTGTLTIKARAYHPDWTASGVMTQSYTIDRQAPTIFGRRFPSAFNSWHLTPVTITFDCRDNVAIASCTLPATISVEGAGQSATGTAVDTAGRQTTITETLNLDLTPPVVTLTSPADALVTTSDSVIVTGTASDGLSGLSSVMCNGVATSVVDGQVSCTVALRPGQNTVALSALDVAGHSASAAITISRVGTAPSSLTLTPNVRTLVVGEQAPLSLRDAFGSAVSGATWSSADPSVVSLSTDDPPRLTALAPGNATISAQKDGFNASSVITVTDMEISAGQQKWSTAPPTSPNQLEQPPIFANPIDATGPDVFTVSMDTTTGERTVWPLTAATGEAHPMIASPGTPLLGDTFGGLIAGVEPDAALCDGGPEPECYKALVRFAGPGNAQAWRYESRGVLDRAAQGPDGAIYVTEHVEGSGLNYDHRSVVVLDGVTGSVRTRVPLPNSFMSNSSSCREGSGEYAPRTLGPIVAADGASYILVSQHKHARQWACSELSVYSELLSETSDNIFRLLRISTDGDVSETMLDDSHRSSLWYPTEPKQLLPDGIGGLLIVADHAVAPAGSGIGPERRVTHLDAEGVRTDTLLDSATRIELIGQDGTAYLSRHNAVGTPLEKKVVDVSTWQTKWQLPIEWSWVAAGPDGGAMVQNTIQRAHFDGAGQLAGSLGLPLTDSIQQGDTSIASGGGLSAYSTNFNDVTLWDATLRYAGISQLETLKRYGNASNQNALTGYQSNYNAIDLVTEATPQFIFDNFVRTFTALDDSTVVDVEVPSGPVTGVGQVVRFALFLVPGILQLPFEVETVRFDPANHVIAAKTLPGHPLFGWRYWKVFQIGPGRVRVETGAVDKPAAGPGWTIASYVSRNDQTKTWFEYLQHIKEELAAEQDSTRPNSSQILRGVWHYDKSYIMQEVCGSQPLPGLWICQ